LIGDAIGASMHSTGSVRVARESERRIVLEKSLEKYRERYLAITIISIVGHERFRSRKEGGGGLSDGINRDTYRINDDNDDLA